MTIKLKGKMENFEAKKKAYMDVVKNEEATPEQHETAFNDMFEALQNDLTEQISKEARNEVHDSQILAARGQNVLTSTERKFFNEVIEFGEIKLPYFVVGEDPEFDEWCRRRGYEVWLVK